MPAPQYVCDTEGSVGLTTATAKTVVGVKAHANSGLLLLGLDVSFDGVAAAGVPALFEPVYATWASNSPGTNSTSTTPRQVLGRVLTAGFTSGKTWTTEPTTLTACAPAIFVPQFNGTYSFRFPLGTEPDSALAEGFALRITATFAGSLNVRAGLIVSRC